MSKSGEKQDWWQRLRPKLLGFIIWSLARAVGLSLRLKVFNFDQVLQRAQEGRGAVLVTWHGRSFIPANVFKGKGFWAIISLSRDGEIQNHIFRRFGFRIIRGSTGRGGIRAALEAARRVAEGGILAFTPDGPRGPNRQVQPGALFIAQKAKCPIIPAGVAAYPCKLLPTWDRYMIPLPFARGVFIFGEPIDVPENISEEQFEQLRQEVEEAINTLEQQAEQMARAKRV
ncbi:MAG: lysophospholipid acyltransferase family protein [Armatimonadota bacterium]|nr:lysophospholipid acyltransferase family protein [bacterium]MDW8321080.1 lysophospholipid acyltransferase family protein [Armatimonadota bacterium]